MPRHNHLFSLGFSVETDEADPEKVTLNELIAACHRRLLDLQGLDREEAREAFADMGDSYPIEKE